VKVVFRTDAAAVIGSGHVMRCLTLADVLRNEGADISFICREHDGHLCDRIAARGFAVSRLPNRHLRSLAETDRPYGSWLGAASQEEDAAETRAAIHSSQGRPDWLVVDHYAADSRWERMLRQCVGRIMVIDDLADRTHDCDLLLDQNYYHDAAERYDNLVSADCVRLLGPKYALLRPEFAAARASSGMGSQPRLFVSVGGSDPFGVGVAVAAALSTLGDRAPPTEIVLGAGAHALTDSVTRPDNVNVHGFVENIAQLMAQCSLAVGAGGSSTWERCALGLPSLVVILAENQRRMVEDLAQAGFVVNLGLFSALGVEDLARAIAVLLEDGPRRARLRQASLELVDCEGGGRVAAEMRRLSACTT
jgi:UDP-2,4-diacetamido-2,4,6-trideoxy-beta-L-altropyranose hydrolase